MKKIEAPITLVAVIEAEQHEALRRVAFSERRSLADVVREAIHRLIEERDAHGVPAAHAAAAKAGRAKERHAAARAK